MENVVKNFQSRLEEKNVENYFFFIEMDKLQRELYEVKVFIVEKEKLFEFQRDVSEIMERRLNEIF